MSRGKSRKEIKEKVIQLLATNQGKAFTILDIAQALGEKPRVIWDIIDWLRKNMPDSLEITKVNRRNVIVFKGIPKKEEAEPEQDLEESISSIDIQELEQKYFEDIKREKSDYASKLLQILEEIELYEQ